MLRRGQDMTPLPVQPLAGDFAGGAVDPRVGGPGQPACALGIEIVQVPKAAPSTSVEEAPPQIGDGSFHPVLGLGPVGPAGPGPEAVVGGEAQHLGIEDGGNLAAVAGYGGAHPVEEYRQGTPPKLTKP